MPAYLTIARDVAATMLPVAAVFLLLALATKRGEAMAAALRCRREAATNLGLVIVNYILFAPLMLMPVLAVRAALPVSPALAELWSALPDLLLLVLAVLLIDSLPVLLLGFPAWSIVAAQLARSWWGYFIHSDVPWTLGPLGEILISPAAHRLHHIRDEKLMGSNYGNMLTLWDRLFGTWRDPAPHLKCATGIAEGTRGVWGELARPWEARYRRTPAPEALEGAL